MSADEFTPRTFLVEYREQHRVLALNEQDAFARIERGESEIVLTDQEFLLPKS